MRCGVKAGSRRRCAVALHIHLDGEELMVLSVKTSFLPDRMYVFTKKRSSIKVSMILFSENLGTAPTS